MENTLVVGILKIVEDKLREFDIQIPDDDREDSTDPLVGYQYAELHDRIKEFLEERGLIDKRGMENYSLNRANSVHFLREHFPSGSSIHLEQTNTFYPTINPGTKGTLDYIDNLGLFHVSWENNRCSVLIPGEDKFSVVSAEQTRSYKNQDPKSIDTLLEEASSRTSKPEKTIPTKPKEPDM